MGKLKSRLAKKYAFAPCIHRVEERWMVTDDPYPIYDEECYCKMGHFDHSGYSGGYSHLDNGREEECVGCPYKQLTAKDKRDFLKLEKEHLKARRRMLKEWLKHRNETEDFTLGNLFDFI